MRYTIILTAFFAATPVFGAPLLVSRKLSSTGPGKAKPVTESDDTEEGKGSGIGSSIVDAFGNILPPVITGIAGTAAQDKQNAAAASQIAALQAANQAIASQVATASAASSAPTASVVPSQPTRRGFISKVNPLLSKAKPLLPDIIKTGSQIVGAGVDAGFTIGGTEQQIGAQASLAAAQASLAIATPAVVSTSAPAVRRARDLALNPIRLGSPDDERVGLTKEIPTQVSLASTAAAATNTATQTTLVRASIPTAFLPPPNLPILGGNGGENAFNPFSIAPVDATMFSSSAAAPAANTAAPTARDLGLDDVISPSIRHPDVQRVQPMSSIFDGSVEV